MRSISALTPEAMEALGIKLPVNNDKQRFIDANLAALLPAMRFLIDMFTAQQQIAIAA